MNRILSHFLLETLVLCLLSAPAFAERSIGLMHCYGGGREFVVEEIVNAFMQNHPDIAVDIFFVDCGNAIRDRFVVQSAAGVPPDVIMVNRMNVPAFAEEGLLLPLDDILPRYDINLENYVEAGRNIGLYAGRRYLLHSTVSLGSSFLFYNRDHFAEAGISPEDGLSDWPSLRETTATLTRLRSDGTIERLGFDPDGPSDDNFLSWAYNNGGSFLSMDLRTVLLNSAENEETLRWMIEMQETVGGRTAIFDFYEAFGQRSQWNYNPFYNAAQSILVSGSWMFGYMQTHAPSIEYGVVQRPANVGKQRRPIALSAGWGYGIASGSRDVDAAARLLRWLTYDTENVVKWNQVTNAVPSLSAVLGDPEFWHGHLMEPYLDTIVRISETLEIVQSVEIQSTLNATLSSAVASALQGAQAPQSALDEAARTMQAALDEYWAKR